MVKAIGAEIRIISAGFRNVFVIEGVKRSTIFPVQATIRAIRIAGMMVEAYCADITGIPGTSRQSFWLRSSPQ